MIGKGIYQAYHETLYIKIKKYNGEELLTALEKAHVLKDRIEDITDDGLPGVVTLEDREEISILHNMYIEELEKYILNKTI